MTDLIGHIGTGITIAKNLAELSRQFDNAVLIRQISDLNLQLAQIQNEAAKMITELRALKEDAEEREKNPLRYTGAIYRDSDDLPFCPGCYDNLRKRIHLSPAFLPNSFNCPVCKSNFEDVG